VAAIVMVLDMNHVHGLGHYKKVKWSVIFTRYRVEHGAWTTYHQASDKFDEPIAECSGSPFQSS
jgi:hypothetical protein